MTKLKEGHFVTFTGIHFNPIEPTLDMININDIAHALSNTCRFGGHTKQFYSVAQHSIEVMKCCRPKNHKHALLHDASEAYISDIVRPLKRTNEMSVYRDVEENLMNIIYNKYDLESHYHSEVKDADLMVLRTEMRDLTSIDQNCLVEEDDLYPPLTKTIYPMAPIQAEIVFKNYAYDLGLI